MNSQDSILHSPSATDDTNVLFSQTMGLVAVTAGMFSLGAYLGRNMSYQWGWAWLIAAFVCLIGLNFAVQQLRAARRRFLFGFGVLVGLAVAPTLAYYSSANPQSTLAGGRSDSALHRRLRRGRIRNAA